MSKEIQKCFDHLSKAYDMFWLLDEDGRDEVLEMIEDHDNKKGGTDVEEKNV